MLPKINVLKLHGRTDEKNFWMLDYSIFYRISSGQRIYNVIILATITCFVLKFLTVSEANENAEHFDYTHDQMILGTGLSGNHSNYF